VNISAWSIRNPIAPILIFFILLVVGWQSFKSLPITRFPNIDVPVVMISVQLAGASPAELETQVTREIEDAVASVTGAKNIHSSVTDSLSITTIEFEMEIPTARAVQDVKDAIDPMVGDLPAGTETPVVKRLDVDGQAILTFGVSSPQMSIEELSWFVDDVVKRRLLSKEGIGKITRFGGVEREIRVELDPVKLESFGISAAIVSRQIAATNVDFGGGRSEIGASEQAIRVLGDSASADSLAATMISVGSGRFVRLGDLGDVIDTFEEPRQFAKFNGDPIVSFLIYRSKGASEVSVANVVEKALDGIYEEYPDVSIELLDDQVTFTEGNYESAIDTLIEGAFLAVFVVFLFLKNWRATLIAAVALPLSAIPTFFVMDLLGFSLNLISLLAITLATGILVDDAIVEIENISRHMGMGKSPYRAAIDAADEIGLAVVSTTAAIVAVFVPVSFMSGVSGQYFGQFGLTVAFSVMFSLLVARLITPLLAAYFMRPAKNQTEAKDGWIMRSYMGLVRITLKVRYLTLLVAFGLLGVSLYFLMQIPGTFIPADDVSRISVNVELPPGSTLADTDAKTSEMQRIISGIEDVTGVMVQGGSSITGTQGIRRAGVVVILDHLDVSLGRKLMDIGHKIPVIGEFLPYEPPVGRLVSQGEIEVEIFKRIESVADVRAFKLNDRGARDISYSILSSNEDDLNEGIALLEAALRQESVLTAVSSEGALPRPEVQITPRPEIMARLGITTRMISEVVRVATIGDFDTTLAKISLDGRRIPVRVQLNMDIRNDILRIGALKISTASGEIVPLNAVADITLSHGPSIIDRLNRERKATIGANLPLGTPLGIGTERFEAVLAATELPPTVQLAKSGDAEIQAELLQEFSSAMISAMMLVLTVLILLFRSIAQPLTIIFSLPLAIGGVAVGLIVTGYSISMPVLIGILMLMGVVTKNAILLVDFAIEEVADGVAPFAAIVDAGHKRARPIIMTSFAMAAGMLPSAIGAGEGGTFRAPMAVAVIGGVTLSTVLSLVVVPSFFLIMDDISRPIGRFMRIFIGPKDEAPVENIEAKLESRLSKTEQKLVRLTKRLKAVKKSTLTPSA